MFRKMHKKEVLLYILGFVFLLIVLFASFYAIMFLVRNFGNALKVEKVSQQEIVTFDMKRFDALKLTR